jgi:Kelch motif
MAGKWQPLTNQPGFNTSTMILLTDGRVMVQEEGTPHWHALTPDDSGSYLNGKWSTLSDMSFWRRYYASGVLRDGRFFLCGGEQSGAGGDTNRGEIYDPVTDKWSPIQVPPWAMVGDAACCVLPDGRVIVGALLSGNCIIYDAGSDSWSTTGGQPGRTNEEGWILLPDDTIVTTQCFPPYRAQKYVIATGAWQDEGALPVTLVDPVMSEVGPAMLMYNGKVIFFGAANSSGHGKSAVYTPPATPTGTGTWAAGPDIPLVGGKVIVCNDCPATLLPNGKVLFAAANFVNNGWGSPVLFFEYDPSTHTIIQAPTPANNATFPYPTSPGVYFSRLMLLPTGQVLFSASSNNVQVYTPDGAPQEAWRPTIGSITAHETPHHVDYFLLHGTQLNGLSQANTYGDDCYPATNYPIVRLTDLKTHKVYYCRSYDFSTMGVATGAVVQSARFNVGNIPDGSYDVSVVANGISSHSATLCYSRSRRLENRGTCCKCECHKSVVCDDDSFVDPAIAELRFQLKLLENTMYRLSAIVPNGGPVDAGQVAKERKSDEDKEAK